MMMMMMMMIFLLFDNNLFCQYGCWRIILMIEIANAFVNMVAGA